MMPIKINRNTFVVIIGAAILLGAMHFGSVYFSDRYKVAKSFIENSDELIKSIGPLKKVSLALLDGAEKFSSSGVVSEAYSFNVAGEKGNGKIRVKVESRDGSGWHVTDARLSTDGAAVVQLVPDAYP